MAKDPAFLFYYDRFISGTYTMTDEQVGQYIRLLCVQANKGYITVSHMNNICKTHDKEVISKFTEIGEGKFVNEVLAGIMDQRRVFTESRRNNRKGKKNDEQVNNMSESYDEHMVNKDVNLNKDVNSLGKSENPLPENNFPQIQIWIEELKTSDHVFQQKVMSAGIKISTTELIEALDDYEGLLAQYPAKQKVVDIYQFRIAALKHVKEYMTKKPIAKQKPMAEIITNDKFKQLGAEQRQRQQDGRTN